jgi:hypothetical protein
MSLKEPLNIFFNIVFGVSFTFGNSFKKDEERLI